MRNPAGSQMISMLNDGGTDLFYEMTTTVIYFTRGFRPWFLYAIKIYVTNFQRPAVAINHHYPRRNDE